MHTWELRFVKRSQFQTCFQSVLGLRRGFSLVSDPVWDICGQDLKTKPCWRECPDFEKPQKIISNFWLCWLFGPWSPAGTEAICRQAQNHNPLLDDGELPPLVGELTHLGLLFEDEGKLDRELERQFGGASALFRALGCGEEGTELEGEAFNLPVDLCRCEQNETQAAEMGSLRTGGWERIERSQLRWSGHLIRGLPGLLHLEVFTSTANWEETSGPTQNALEGLHISYGLGNHMGSPRRSWTSLTGERDVKSSPRSLLLSVHIFTGRFSRNSVKICTKFHQADPWRLRLSLCPSSLQIALGSYLLERGNVDNSGQDFCGGTVSWRTWTNANTPFF